MTKARTSYRRLKWTEALDARLRELWPTNSVPHIARKMGLRETQIASRRVELKLPKRSRSPQHDPPEDAWYSEAVKQAAIHGVRLVHVMNGAKTPSATLARRRAFLAIKTAYPYCSNLGIARVSGFDSECVCRGLKAITRRIEAAE